jgi:hypothetical protein
MPMESFAFFKLCNSSSRIMALRSTHPLTEMSTKNLPGGKEWSMLKAEDLTAMFEPIVQKTWHPRRLKTVWACYRDSFTYYCQDTEIK